MASNGRVNWSFAEVEAESRSSKFPYVDSLHNMPVLSPDYQASMLVHVVYMGPSYFEGYIQCQAGVHMDVYRC